MGEGVKSLSHVGTMQSHIAQSNVTGITTVSDVRDEHRGLNAIDF